MATAEDIATAQILLGGTERWSSEQVGAAIDSTGGVPQAAVLLLESAATAAAFNLDVKAGSQSVKASHVAQALRDAAQQIRDDYGLGGGLGTVTTLLPTTGRDILGDDGIMQDHSTHAAVFYNGIGVIGYGDDYPC